ncbi:thiol:disulfide interchange protein DsbA/DsbL [Actimicrobium antarcticum]|uniref:Thiol:disulfide interchange protein DsbA n=1 Tax=Actimicrobium antarcticum TaxID=1051899 RepID=A0ABP7TYH5_9BURK
MRIAKFTTFTKRLTTSFPRLVATLGLGLTLGLAASVASASPVAPQSGAEYRTLERAQPTESGKKIEVTEFFWYACPHCYAFEPSLAEWVKKQGDNIVFKRVPISFRESFVPQQKLYYALEAMGKSEEMQRKVFNAIHVERQAIDTDATILDFIGKQGIDKQKFADTYNSFGMQSKVKRALSLQEAYKIDGVPTVAIDGKYITSPSIVGTAMGGRQPEPVLASATLQVMDALVAKAQAEHKATAAPAKK